MNIVNELFNWEEQPEKVFNFGGLGIDNINNLELLSKPDLEKRINFKFDIEIY